ncbi:glycosyl transferase, group 4 [Thermacetogenium phaeum DSM 12270]|uniref:Glycosyl transferase, group 4 n=1 Tax=Thermacetogenium phaeum (strain ATCC BAA-254 / DSM 26808 / PB) TaxID=1089553 RepID=K4LQY7_THEPS|nr:glycosyltransferase family 4 protein [Thermacetogenium phaeum]AFV10514.1 glycosyl transferase, group 4 [Thermacetogenium phaeum DSM 12270]
MSVWILIVIILVFLLSFIVTGRVRKYALDKEILDIPNDRSSHDRPTPLGGGLAVAILFITVIAILALSGFVSLPLAAALCCGGLLVAGIGWIDDCFNVRPSLRALVHLVAAVWSLYWLGGLNTLNLGIIKCSMGAAGSVLAVVGTVWLINLYNFMDGIDGIAGSEAFVVGFIGGSLELAFGRPDLAVISWLLASASAGFLLWNWPPAKIFMGDIGSGFIGFVFAVLAIASEKSGALPLLVWLMLLGVFIVDATATLLRRIVRGERWTEAHRTHAYQLAVQAGYSHKQVTIAVIIVNMILGCAAAIAALWPKFILLISVLVALALIVLRAEVIRRCTHDQSSSLSVNI